MDHQDYGQSFQQETYFYEDQKPPMPNNNLPLAIVSTVLGCCSPCLIGFILGIVAIVFSTQVTTKYNMGDYAGAQSAAKTTKILCYIVLGLFVLGIIMTVFNFLINGSAAFYDSYLKQFK